MAGVVRPAIARIRDKVGGGGSVRRRLLSLYAASLVFILLFFVLSVVTFVVRTETTAWRGRQGEAALNASQTVAAFVKQVEDLLFMVDELGRDELQAKPASLQGVLARNPALLEVVYLDPLGRVVSGAAIDRPLLSDLFTAPMSEWFLRARDGRHYHGQVQISSRDEPYLILALPARDDHVIACRLRMDVLWKVVADIRFGEQGTAYIVGRDGDLIAHTDPQVVMRNATIRGTPGLKEMLDYPERPWYGEYVNFAGVKAVGASSPVPDSDWIVITELPTSEAFRVSRIALLILLNVVGLYGGLVMLVVTRLLNAHVLRPIEALEEAARKVASGNLAHRVTASGAKEVAQVAAAFNGMLDRLDEQRLQLQRELAERRQAQDALRLAHDELEERVLERTADLERVNVSLSEEVAERQRAEQLIKASLAEKEVLLKEIHHRVKNNLQVISSLLFLQSHDIAEPAMRELFLESQNRVRSMALVHEKLYRSTDIARIDFGEYVQNLTAYLFRSVRPGGDDIEFRVSVEPVYLDIDAAVPAGLILNELVSNALKHAFPAGRSGTVEVRFRSTTNGLVCLSVVDDGVGFPPGVDFRSSPSLGLQLVNTLAAQLGGTLELTADRGTEVWLTFSGQPSRMRDTGGLDPAAVAER